MKMKGLVVGKYHHFNFIQENRKTKLKGKGEVSWSGVNVSSAGVQARGGHLAERCVAQCSGKILVWLL